MTDNTKMLIIGNGPSTRALAERGFENLPADVDTFGMGAAYRYYQKIGWWPTYYALCDPKVVFSHRNELAAIVEDPGVATRRFFFSVPLSEHPRFELIPHSTTGDFCCRKAIEEGYRQIFLIGIEGRYVEEITGSRPMSDDEYDEFGLETLHLSDNHRRTLRIITDTPDDNPNYFFYGYQRAGDIYSLPQSGVHRRGWNETAEVVDTAGVTVLNLSRHSSVDNFPRSTLAELFGDGEGGGKYWYGPFERDDDKRIEEAGMVLDLMTADAGMSAQRTPVMLDVGACKGTALRGFAEAGWTVHAFEPNPPVFEALRETFNSPNVTLNGVAVSDVEGEDLPFYTSDESLGISSLKPFRPTHEETARVRTITLDGYLDAHDVGAIDFLKIDTEGFDLMVLKGLDLGRHAVETIVCEFEDRKTRSLGYSMSDMAEYLESFGYTVYVSEWHPVVHYGGPHQWRALKTFPCDLEAPDAWGNLFAFKSDPGIWALTHAVNRSVKRFEAPGRKKGREEGREKGREKDRARARATRRQAGMQPRDGLAETDTGSKQTAALDAKLALAQHRIEDLERQLSEVFGSTSWRITAPLRLAKTASSRVLRRGDSPADQDV